MPSRALEALGDGLYPPWPRRPAAFGVYAWRGLVFALTLGLTSACSSSSSSHADENAAIGDVVYVGATTDEALSRFLDAPPKDSAAEYIAFDTPQSGQTLAKDPPPTFLFHQLNARNEVHPAPRHGTPNWARRARWDLESLFAGLPLAYAHGTPFNGTAFWLVFSDSYAKAQLRVFSDQTAYTPDSSALSTLASAAQPITLTVTSAVFEENAIPPGGGPFVGGSVEFTLR